jgi:hypothetical protein
MSRKIDMDNLDDDDKLYLAQRGQLPTDVMSREEQRLLLNPEEANQATMLANTGTANTAGLTTEQLEEELERRRAAEVTDPRTLFGQEGVAGALAGEEDEDTLEPPYDQYTKSELLAELSRRNDNREDDNQLPLSGNKDDLVARLDEDDADEE